MSHDDHDDPPGRPRAPTYLQSLSRDASRRQVLQLLSALGGVAAAGLPAIAQAGPTWQPLPHHDIITRALTQPLYRARLLDKPKKTLAEEHGIVLGATVTLVVVVDTMELVHVVLSSHAGMRGPEEGVVADILQQYRNDVAFRTQLVNNPRQAFEDWTGATIPQILAVQVVQETPIYRVIQLPAEAALGVETPEEVQSLWGGDDGWGGDESWTETSTIESGQICNCISEGTDLETHISSCCFDPPETQTPF